MDYWLASFSTQADGTLTASQDSLIVSILSAGTFFGALTAAPFGDLLGRRWGLMASAGLVFNLGVILQTASTTQPLFIAGRFFAGYGVGLVSALSKFDIKLSAYSSHSERCWNAILVKLELGPWPYLTCIQFPCISPRRRQSGSAVPSLARISLQSRLVCSWLPL